MNSSVTSKIKPQSSYIDLTYFTTPGPPDHHQISIENQQNSYIHPPNLTFSHIYDDQVDDHQSVIVHYQQQQQQTQLQSQEKIAPCKPVKIKLRNLGDTQWDEIEKQQKLKREQKINKIFDNLYKVKVKQVSKPTDQNINLHRASNLKQHLGQNKSSVDLKGPQLRREAQKQRLEELQLQREAQLSQKLQRAQLSLQKFNQSKQDAYEFHLEGVQKRTLRAKITNLLKTRTPLICAKYLDKYHKTKVLRDKFQALNQPDGNSSDHHSRDTLKSKNHHRSTGIVQSEVKLPQLANPEEVKFSNETPDDVLVTYFTDQELQMIQEDPHFYIQDLRYRDLITIFQAETLETLLDEVEKANLKTFKERYLEEKMLQKDQEMRERRQQMVEKFKQQQLKMQKLTNTLNVTTHVSKIRHLHTQPHSPAKTQSLRAHEHEYRQSLHIKQKQKQLIAEEKRQREKLKTFNKVMELKEKLQVKQNRIFRNRERLLEHQNLMKNYYAKIEENCMQKQVKEITDIMKQSKLQPVQKHLNHWRQKITQTRSQSLLPRLQL